MRAVTPARAKPTRQPDTCGGTPVGIRKGIKQTRAQPRILRQHQRRVYENLLATQSSESSVAHQPLRLHGKGANDSPAPAPSSPAGRLGLSSAEQDFGISEKSRRPVKVGVETGIKCRNSRNSLWFPGIRTTPAARQIQSAAEARGGGFLDLDEPAGTPQYLETIYR